MTALPKRFFRPATVLVLSAAIAVLAGPASSPAASSPAAVEQTIARVGPSLVRLNVVETGYGRGKEDKRESVGSGVIISPQGYVVTNHHVAGNARRIVCILADNEEVPAKLIGTDPLSDIAVVKLEGEADRVYPSVEFADSDQLRVGQEVLAMGNPLALAKAVTRGIVSNTHMVMPGSFRRRRDFQLQGESVGSMVRWLVHDARIFPGNSGGPLVDLDGRVVGINEVQFGLSGAIPANLAREVASQIIEHGRVRRSWLGMDFQPRLKRSGQDSGVIVREVVEGSPAALAGVRSGDLLLELGGAPVSARFDEEIPPLNLRVAALPIGAEAPALLLRDGEQIRVTMKTVERQPLQMKDAELPDWGLAARDLSFLSATELKLQDKGGVLVTSIRPAGPAGKSKPALQGGDVIREVAKQKVANLRDLEALTERLTEGRTEPLPVLVAFTRTPEELLTEVEIGSKKKDPVAADARKAWLPAALQVVTRAMATELGDANLRGLRVTQVYAGGSAEKAGLETGDVIVALDGSDVDGSEPGDEARFAERLRQYAIGTKVKLSIRRGAEAQKVEKDLEVELERSPKLERELKRFEDEHFEFEARDIGFFDRVREAWSPQRKGAIVVEVGDGGWAALGELSAGDLVLAVDDTEIDDVAALETKMKEISATKPPHVVFRVLRGIHTWYLQLETAWTKP